MSTLRLRHRREGGLGALVLLFAVLLPIFGSDAFRLQEYEYIVALTLVAVGLNVTLGFAGQLALGPSGIFGVAGYSAAVFADHYASSAGLLIMAVIGVAGATVIGLVVAVPALRVGHFYLGMATLAVALMVPTIAKNLDFTGAELGITLIGLPDFVPQWSGASLYYLSIAILVVTVAGSWLLLHSRVGQRFQALASSEDLAASMGIVGYRTKLLAFVVGAWPAGIGAAVYLYTQQFFVPSSANDLVSIYVLAACVVGGLGTTMGPVVGGIIVFGLDQFLGSLAQWQDIVFGVLLAGFAILCPEGIVGLLEGNRSVPAALDVRRWFSARSTVTDHGESPIRRRTPREVVAAEDRAAAEPPSVGAPGELVLANVERSFGGVKAVGGVDLVVRPGTTHALIGSNGSGKTTILNLISGFYRIDSGSIELAGTRLDGISAAGVARRGVGRTFQAPKLLTRQTLLENVQAAAAMAGPGGDLGSILRLPSGLRARRESRRVALEMIGEVGLSDYADETVSRLPHGLRRLGEVARSLAAGPRILLLDEPAAGLTHSELELLHRAIDRATARGVAVLLVEHNMPFVFRLADEVTVMHLGLVIARGTPSEIRADERVSRAFLGSQVELIDENPELAEMGTEHG